MGGVSLKNKNKPHTHKRGAEQKGSNCSKEWKRGKKSDEDFFFFSFSSYVSVFWFTGRFLLPSKLPVSVPSQTGQELAHESPH